MPKVNVYVDQSLKDRMDEHPNLNWSAIAQRAFDLEILSNIKGNNMEQVIERLRASKELEDAAEKPDWVAQGREWASKYAKFGSLKRMAAIEADEVENVRILIDAMIRADLQREPDHHDRQEVVEQLTGDERGTVTVEQIQWYLEGVRDVWDEVADEI